MYIIYIYIFINMYMRICMCIIIKLQKMCSGSTRDSNYQVCLNMSYLNLFVVCYILSGSFWNRVLLKFVGKGCLRV